jgi:hypothetical protein
VDRITVFKARERGGRTPVDQRVRIEFAKHQEMTDADDGQQVT